MMTISYINIKRSLSIYYFTIKLILYVLAQFFVKIAIKWACLKVEQPKKIPILSLEVLKWTRR